MLVLAPVLFLLLVELVLWIVGFGRPTEFFIERESLGRTVYTTNEEFCRQFVGASLSRAPAETVLSEVKDDSTVRIFVLGGSAAGGDPDSDFGFCRVLETMLNQQSQGRSFKVINSAVTAMNSHVARRIAADCRRHSPDAFVVYMGNNEVVGPYGPRSLPKWLYRSTSVVRGIIAISSSRTKQLIASLGKDPPARRWQGMEAFLEQEVPFDDSALSDCYGHFEENIGDIIRYARDAGASVVLCTVPTNIRSCPPFGSQHAQNLSEPELSRWKELFDEGRRLYKDKKFVEAMGKYQAASDIDDLPAVLAYARGQCALAAGDVQAASKYYILARDRDTLRFRADSRINAIIRQQGRTGRSESISLADLETQLSGNAPGGLLGSDLLHDHVHLNFRGSFLAALTAARSLRDVLPACRISIPSEPGEVQKLETNLQKRLVYDQRARYDLAVTMYRRRALPPFVGQLDYEEQMDTLWRDLVELRKTVKTKVPGDIERNYLAAIAKAPSDAVLIRRLADFRMKYGRITQAREHLERSLKTTPHSLGLRKKLSVAAAIHGPSDEAVGILTSSENPFAWDEKAALAHIGTGLIQSGHPMRSEGVYKRLLELDSDNIDALVNMGAVMNRKGEPELALEYLNRAIQIAPHRVDALGNMANAYIKQGDSKTAGQWLAKAMSADPYDDMIRLSLGAHQVIRTGNSSQGVENLKRCVELNPTSFMAYQLLAKIHMASGDQHLAGKYRGLAELFSGP